MINRLFPFEETLQTHPTSTLAFRCKNQWNKLSGTWKERRDEGARKERRANANRLSQSSSSVSAALLGLSGLANDNGNIASWDASALLTAVRPPKSDTIDSPQRGEKRRRQVPEAQKPFNDDALRQAVRPSWCLSLVHLLVVPNSHTAALGEIGCGNMQPD